jgi:tetratricopeptide (TPR) repeat protein
MWETLSVTDFSAMARLFRDAIDLDPGNAKALAGLSLALIADKLMGNLNIQMAAASAKDALRRSLEIDPESLEATCSKAWLKIASERDWEGGGRGFAEVLRHVPLCGPALIGRALLHIAQGRLAEASDLLSEASIQYPLSAPTMLFQCWNDYLTGQYAKALDLIAQARAIGHCGSALDAVEALSLTGLEDPDESVERVKALIAGSPPGSSHHHLLQGVLGYSYAAAGRTHEAQTALHNFMHSKIPPNTSHGYSLALILLGLNDRENAVRWLQKSYCEGSLWSFGFRSDPILAPLRNEPYRQLLFDNLSYPASEGLPSRLASAS